MNNKTLTKHYDKLNERERAALVINAFGRKDECECNRLIDASPRVTLDAPDFGRMVMRLIDVIGWHTLRQAENAASLFLIVHWAGDETKWDNAQLPTPDDSIMAAAYNIVVRADGWKIFCGELGLDSASALRIVGADVVIADIAERIARAVKPDLDRVRAGWRIVRENAEPKTAEEIAAEYRDLVNASASGRM